MAKQPNARTASSEVQLQAALRNQVRHADMQNRAIGDMSKRLGAAGLCIETIKKALDDDGLMNEAKLERITKAVKKLEGGPGRGAGKDSKRS